MVLMDVLSTHMLLLIVHNIHRSLNKEPASDTVNVYNVFKFPESFYCKLTCVRTANLRNTPLEQLYT
jgi:hypothetical protein